MSGFFFWNGEPVSFQAGETIAAALLKAGIIPPNRGQAPLDGRAFCGIGACQGCVVAVEGAAPVEACLTPAAEGLRLGWISSFGADHA